MITFSLPLPYQVYYAYDHEYVEGRISAFRPEFVKIKYNNFLFYQDKGSELYNTTIKSYYPIDSRLSLSSLFGSELIDAIHANSYAGTVDGHTNGRQPPESRRASKVEVPTRTRIWEKSDLRLPEDRRAHRILLLLC